jgi:hypothetical protein
MHPYHRLVVCVNYLLELNCVADKEFFSCVDKLLLVFMNEEGILLCFSVVCITFTRIRCVA